MERFKSIPSDEKWFLAYGGITSLSLAENILVSGTAEGEIYLWHWPLKPRKENPEKGRFPRRIPHMGPNSNNYIEIEFQLPLMANSILIDQDRKTFITNTCANSDYIAITARENVIQLYSTKSYNKIGTYSAFKPCTDISLSKEFFAYTSPEGCAIIDLKSNKYIDNGIDFFGQYFFTKMKFFENHLIGTDGEKIEVIKIPSGEKVNEIIPMEKTDSWVNQVVAISLDYPYLGLLTKKGVFEVWNLEIRKMEFNSTINYQEVENIAVSKELVAVADSFGKIHVFNWRTNEKLKIAQTSFDICENLILTKDKLVVSNGILEIWNL